MASENREIIYRLPERIKEIRDSKDMTQEDLGLAMGSDKSAVSKIECGTRTPSLDTIAKVADALGVPISDLFSKDESEDLFLLQFKERASKIPQEKKELFEKMINTALEFAGV